MTKEQAQRKAKALVRKMRNPKGWKTRVWENLGWHYCIEKGAVSVWSSFDGTFFCMISSDVECPGSGLGMWTTTYHSKDPNVALRMEAASAREVLDRLIKAVESAESA